MSEDTPSGRLQWVRAKISDWLFARLLDVLVSAGLFVVVIAWIRAEWACIGKPWCTVSGWSLGLLIAFTVVTTCAALFCGRQWYRVGRELRARQPKADPPRFRDIEVLDHQLNLRWFIRRPPREWLQWRNIARTVAPSAVQQVLDGPFHAVPGCNAQLVEIPARATVYGSGSPQFDELCRTCGAQIFRGISRGVNVWPVRADALEELQRMQRNGTKIPEAQWREPIVLERPEYWKVMLPPSVPQRAGGTPS